MRRGEGIVFASELKAIVAALGSRARRRPRGAWSPRPSTTGCRRVRRRSGASSKLPAGSWAEYRRDGSTIVSGRVLEPRDDGRRGRRRSRRTTCAAPSRTRSLAHLVADVPGGVLPQWWPRLQHRDRARAPRTTPRSRRTPSPSGPRTSGSRRCPTTRTTPARWPRTWASGCTRSRSSPDVVDMLPRMVDMLDEPIGDPAAINTWLMCEAARRAGVKVLLSGMGADELFGGYRKHLACLLAERYRRAPAWLRTGVVAPLVGRLPVAVGGRGSGRCAGPSGSSPSPSSVRRRRSGAATRSTTRRAGRPPRPGPRRPRRVGGRRPQERLRGQRPRRPGEPDVPRRHPAVHAGPEPDLHRPREHGGLDRGARARSWTRWCSLRRSRSRARRRSADGCRRRRSRTRPGAGSPTRSSTGRRRRSAPRCGPG